MDKLGKEPLERVINAIWIALFAALILMEILFPGTRTPLDPNTADECDYSRCVTIQVAGATV